MYFYMPLKIATIIGARPQFIKAAAISRAINTINQNDGSPLIHQILVHTGQHYDRNLSQIFFNEMEIPQPHYNLEVGSGPHGKQTGLMLEKIEEVLIHEKPDLCLVYGDTNSTLSGALAAAKLHIPVGHIEAGLRSYFRQMPEEINRILTDHLSTWLFCPTNTAVDNLKKEGINKGVYQTGDVMYDSILFYSQKVKAREHELLDQFQIRAGHYYLATIHRAENTDDPGRLTEILAGLNAIASSDCPVILPLHPRTAHYIKQHRIFICKAGHLIEPVSYLTMIGLEKQARLILTDSGGVQKEAYFLSIPCVTLRDQTEWIESVQAGRNRLAGASREKIIRAVTEPFAQQDIRPETYYGNGHAAEVILQILLRPEDSV